MDSWSATPSLPYGSNVGNSSQDTRVQLSSVQARDRPSGLRAFAEVLLEPSGRDVRLGSRVQVHEFGALNVREHSSRRIHDLIAERVDT